MVRVLLWLLNWFDSESKHLIVPRDPLFHKAEAITLAQEYKNLGPGSGERKRRDTFAALMKACPEASKRAIALAIEAALP